MSFMASLADNAISIGAAVLLEVAPIPDGRIRQLVELGAGSMLRGKFLTPIGRGVAFRGGSHLAGSLFGADVDFGDDAGPMEGAE